MNTLKQKCKRCKIPIPEDDNRLYCKLCIRIIKANLWPDEVLQ